MGNTGRTLQPIGFSEREMRARFEETGEYDGDGALKLDDGRFVSVPEAMAIHDVSPILRRFGTWAVTEYGVECLTSSYPIEKDRLGESDWLPHVGQKPWVVYEDFRDALYFAKKTFGNKSVPEVVRQEPPTIPGNDRRPRKSHRPSLSTRLRFLVLKRDGYACQLCGRAAAQGALLHVDHKLARAKGGSDDVSNLWTLCSLCNLGKGVDEL